MGAFPIRNWIRRVGRKVQTAHGLFNQLVGLDGTVWMPSPRPASYLLRYRCRCAVYWWTRFFQQQGEARAPSRTRQSAICIPLTTRSCPLAKVPCSNFLISSKVDVTSSSCDCCHALFSVGHYFSSLPGPRAVSNFCYACVVVRWVLQGSGIGKTERRRDCEQGGGLASSG